MSKKENNTKNKKQLIIICSIVAIIGLVIGAILFNNQQKPIENTNVIEQPNNEISDNQIDNTTQNIENNTNIDEIVITGNSNTINFEMINTNCVDDFSFFTKSNDSNFTGGNYKVITSYSDYIEFMENNNIDILNERFSRINEHYFEKNVIICVIDSYEEKYQHRIFLNFAIESATTYINYIKTNENITDTGYWTYMIGVDYETLGKTEIEKLPISINIFD